MLGIGEHLICLDKIPKICLIITVGNKILTEVKVMGKKGKDIVGVDVEDLIKDLKADIGKLLHGEQEYEYFRPIRPGDKLTCKLKIKDIYTKEGKAGPMDMVVTETDYVNDKGELAARARAVLVIRS